MITTAPEKLQTEPNNSAKIQEQELPGVDTMEVAVLQAPGTFAFAKAPMPKPAPEEVVYKVEGSGVCASSIPVFEGRDWFSYPVPAGNPGHEAWGVVTEIGSAVKNIKAGDRIAALSYNGFAEFDKALASNVVILPSNLQDFPGEPLGCAMNIFHRSEIQKGQTVAIVGIGFLGALLVQLCKNAGAKVVALSLRQHSLEVAKEFGADETILLDDHYKIIDKMREITGEKFCERVIEATGKEWPLNLAGELTAERGRLIIAGYHQDGMRSVNIQLWNWRGIDVINAHERDPQIYVKGIQAAVDAATKGIITPEKLYSFYSFQNIQQAFQDMICRPEGFIKAIIKH